MGPAQAIVLPQTLPDISKVKNLTYSKIEAVFQSGMHDVELSMMAERNLSGEEVIMFTTSIPAYMVYGDFNQDISPALVYKIIWDSKHNSPMQDHALSLLRSFMVGIWRKIDTKPFAPHRKFYKMLPLQNRMWSQRQFKKILPTLVPAENTGLSQTVPQTPS